jgi:hypothetical protein
MTRTRFDSYALRARDTHDAAVVNLNLDGAELETANCVPNPVSSLFETNLLVLVGFYALHEWVHWLFG